MKKDGLVIVVAISPILIPYAGLQLKQTYRIWKKLKKKKKKIYVLKVLTKGVKNVLLLLVACDMFSVVVRTQVSINYYKIGVYKRVIILKSRLGLKHITERLGDISTSTS